MGLVLPDKEEMDWMMKSPEFLEMYLRLKFKNLDGEVKIVFL
jgi:hypothetical protein